MSAVELSDGGYVVPTYRAAADASWFHFLHGNVPGHQIDFIYRPDVPQGPLKQQHFSHLAPFIKYIEPRPSSSYAFAIANLSRDDTQHEPGHGAIALILGLRVKGALDHAGRRDPPFAHAIVGVNREIDPEALLELAVLFYRRLLGEPGREGSGAVWGMYSRFIAGNAASRLDTLRSYVASLGDLPRHKQSALSLKWTSRGASQQKAVVIVHPDDASFEVIARCAARIAVVLYQSDLRWTSITTGREGEISNGVTIRFVPERESGGYGAESQVVPIEQLPESSLEIATRLFALTPIDAGRVSGPAPVRGEVAKAQLPSPKPWKAAVLSASAGVKGGSGPALESGSQGPSRGVLNPTEEPERSRRRAVVGLGLGVALLIPAVFAMSYGLGENRRGTSANATEHVLAAPLPSIPPAEARVAEAPEAPPGAEKQPSAGSAPPGAANLPTSADGAHDPANGSVEPDSMQRSGPEPQGVAPVGVSEGKQSKGPAVDGASVSPRVGTSPPRTKSGARVRPIGGDDPRW